MNGVLISRVRLSLGPTVDAEPRSYSLARPVPLGTVGPMVARDAIKDLIDCEYLGCNAAIWDGLQVTLWHHDDEDGSDWEPCDEMEREIACEITSYSGFEVIGLLEGPLLVTGAVTAEGIIGLTDEDAQCLADRVNGGHPLRGFGDLLFTFTELLVPSDIL